MSAKIKVIFEWLLTMLRLFKSDPAKAREFTELVTDQYDYLVLQIEKFQKDYFELCERIKLLYTEISGLREEMSKDAGLKCNVKDCNTRISG